MSEKNTILSGARIAVAQNSGGFAVSCGPFVSFGGLEVSFGRNCLLN